MYNFYRLEVNSVVSFGNVEKPRQFIIYSILIDCH